jgi:hypothetical protein
VARRDGGVAAIGIPGAVALGAVGAWVACRRAGIRLGPVAAAAAPAVAFGLAIGGLGNWWAQQFYGQPSTWWWAVQISPEHRVPGYENYATFQPVFLYQSLWDVALGPRGDLGRAPVQAQRRAHVLLGAAVYAVGGCGWNRCASARCRMCWAYATVHSAIWQFSSWLSRACT